MFQYVAYPSWISPFVIPGLPVRWYSVMYLVAFSITFILFIRQRNKGLIEISNDDAYTLFLYTIAGLILGARLFSTLFYNGSTYYWTHPWMIFWPFSNGQFVGLPGMSYHGGVVGAVVGGLIFSKRYRMKFLSVEDAVVAGIPLGYTFGRLDNFINCEWVRNSADNIGMEYSAGVLGNLPRHPSQLYEALFEGVVLWLFIWFFIRRRNKYPGYTLGWYIVGYGIVRFLIEYLREPDSNIGFIISWGASSEPTALFLSPFNISMGQLLSILMIGAGVLVLLLSKQYHRKSLSRKKSHR